MNAPDYLNISPDIPLPKMSTAPFRAIIVSERSVDSEWQTAVSEWLVRNGCLYMIAWGPNSSSWDDSVDYANLDAFDYGDIPDDKFVMTTWHDKEPLSEAFWFAHNAAFHPSVDLERTLIVDVSPYDRRSEMMAAYKLAIRADT